MSEEKLVLWDQILVEIGDEPHPFPLPSEKDPSKQVGLELVRREVVARKINLDLRVDAVWISEVRPSDALRISEDPKSPHPGYAFRIESTQLGTPVTIESPSFGDAALDQQFLSFFQERLGPECVRVLIKLRDQAMRHVEQKNRLVVPASRKRYRDQQKFKELFKSRVEPGRTPTGWEIDFRNQLKTAVQSLAKSGLRHERITLDRTAKQLNLSGKTLRTRLRRSNIQWSDFKLKMLQDF
ncbi:MAG: hypothetical protein HY774_26930 [Acidobacteria bacterium]|nr:hypothetical protein [Acidobacteriota bacterium]